MKNRIRLFRVEQGGNGKPWKMEMMEAFKRLEGEELWPNLL